MGNWVPSLKKGLVVAVWSWPTHDGRLGAVSRIRKSIEAAGGTMTFTAREK